MKFLKSTIDKTELGLIGEAQRLDRCSADKASRQPITLNCILRRGNNFSSRPIILTENIPD